MSSPEGDATRGGEGGERGLRLETRWSFAGRDKSLEKKKRKEEKKRRKEKKKRKEEKKRTRDIEDHGE